MVSAHSWHKTETYHNYNLQRLIHVHKFHVIIHVLNSHMSLSLSFFETPKNYEKTTMKKLSWKTF